MFVARRREAARHIPRRREVAREKPRKWRPQAARRREAASYQNQNKSYARIKHDFFLARRRQAAIENRKGAVKQPGAGRQPVFKIKKVIY